MPIIEVSLLTGRREEDLRRLIHALHDTTVQVLGAPPESVKVLLREIPPEHWGSGGSTIAEKRAAERDERADAPKEGRDGAR